MQMPLSLVLQDPYSIIHCDTLQYLLCWCINQIYAQSYQKNGKMAEQR